jgi:hypothetical protein
MMLFGSAGRVRLMQSERELLDAQRSLSDALQRRKAEPHRRPGKPVTVKARQ